MQLIWKNRKEGRITYFTSIWTLVNSLGCSCLRARSETASWMAAKIGVQLFHPVKQSGPHTTVSISKPHTTVSISKLWSIWTPAANSAIPSPNTSSSQVPRPWNHWVSCLLKGTGTSLPLLRITPSIQLSSITLMHSPLAIRVCIDSALAEVPIMRCGKLKLSQEWNLYLALTCTAHAPSGSDTTIL